MNGRTRSECSSVAGDIGDESFVSRLYNKQWMNLANSALVNNAAEQHPQESIADISALTTGTHLPHQYFLDVFLTKAALKHLKEGSAIINTTSVTAYKGSPQLLDYSSTKGDRCLYHSLVSKFGQKEFA